MEIHEEKIKEIAHFMEQNRLYEGLQALVAYLKEHNVNNPKMRDEAETMMSNYNMMLNCFKSGMVDPKKEEIFDNLLAFLRDSVLNLQLYSCISKNSTLQAAKNRAEKLDLHQLDVLVREKHEDPEFLNTLFSAILVSWCWTDDECEYFTNIITDPTTDYKVVALMLSALLLSYNISPDIRKCICLCNSYRRLHNPKLKQRALVGFAFCVCLWSIGDTDQLINIVCELCKDEGFISELVEMQKQFYLCINAAKDAKEVDDRILEHFKNGDFGKLDKFNSEDNSLNEILHPEQEEEKIEKLEKTISGMMDMQKAGSDVYFNGFAQMKSFAFFHRLSNWFLPYYKENPILQPLLKSLDGNEKMLQNIQDNSPFCESDKYSFSLAIDFSLQKSLAPIKNVLKEGFLFDNAPFWRDEDDESTIARRMYLQDLYRFCKLSSFRGIFADFFQVDGTIFKNFSILIFGVFLRTNEEVIKNGDDSMRLDDLVNIMNANVGWDSDELADLAKDADIHTDELAIDGDEKVDASSEEIKKGFLLIKKGIHDICDFLVKHKQYKALETYLKYAADLPFLDCYFYRCVAQIFGSHEYHAPYTLLKVLNEMNPDDMVVIKLLAKCACETHDFEGACKYFRELVERTDSDAYRLKYASCLLKCEKADDALSILFELNYKYPDNEDVIRLLAWGKVLQENYEDAISKYDSLINMAESSRKKVMSEDYYNKGLCYLLLGNISEAVKQFKSYSSNLTGDEPAINDKIEEDYDFLMKYGISGYDIRLVVDCALANS